MAAAAVVHTTAVQRFALLSDIFAFAHRITLNPDSIGIINYPVTYCVGDILNPDDVVPSFQFGHALVRQIWKQMDLDTFFETKSGKRNAEIVAQAIYYLAAHRCAEPGSYLRLRNMAES